MCATFFAQNYNIPLLVIGSATGDALLSNAATIYTQVVPSLVPFALKAVEFEAFLRSSVSR